MALLVDRPHLMDIEVGEPQLALMPARPFAEGEPGDRLYIVVSGKVKLTRRSPDGRARLLIVIGPPDMFGALSTLDAGTRTDSASTITAVRAASMDRDAIRAWITKWSPT